jgi:hypothetical protein
MQNKHSALETVQKESYVEIQEQVSIYSPSTQVSDALENDSSEDLAQTLAHVLDKFLDAAFFPINF